VTPGGATCGRGQQDLAVCVCVCAACACTQPVYAVAVCTFAAVLTGLHLLSILPHVVNSGFLSASCSLFKSNRGKVHL